MSTAPFSPMRASSFANVLVPSVALRSMVPAGVFSASALVCTALWAAFVALGLFAFLTVEVPREVFWVLIAQLAAGSRTVRKASYALAALMTSRGYRGE